MENIQKFKNFLWFLIFLGLSLFLIYIAGNMKHTINNPISNDLSDLDSSLLKIFFASIIFLDFGFLSASFWNLYKFIRLLFKRKNKKEIK